MPGPSPRRPRWSPRDEYLTFSGGVLILIALSAIIVAAILFLPRISP